MSRKENKLEELKLFVSRLMNEEQEKHAKKVESLSTEISIEVVAETIKTLTIIHNAKMDLLDRVYKEAQKLQ